MSKTYGTIQGQRGPATRCGSRNGVQVSAQSYDGSVVVRNWYDDKDQVHFEIGTNDSSSSGMSWSTPSFRGTYNEVVEALKLLEDVKSGRASVVHHRKRGA